MSQKLPLSNPKLNDETALQGKSNRQILPSVIALRFLIENLLAVKLNMSENIFSICFTVMAPTEYQIL